MIANRGGNVPEYATVGYMSKRIQMRKQRFVAIQKIMSEKKMPAECAPPWDAHSLSKAGSLSRGAPPPPRHSLGGAPPPPPRHHGSLHSVDRCRHLQEVRYKARDPKAHSKGATLESSLEDNPAPSLHTLHPTKVRPLFMKELVQT